MSDSWCVASLLLCAALTLTGSASASPSTDPAAPSADPQSQATDPPSQSDPAQQESKSSYEDPQVMGGGKSVGGQLLDDDSHKRDLFRFNLVPDTYYALKRRLKERTGIELGVDYNLLNQYASTSSTDRQASSGALRFYGQWSPPGDESPRKRALVFRFETRHVVGSGITPRDLGFDAGSALSTASFKAFGWGVTSLYWEQESPSGRFAFVAGQMDPGDFEDLHPLLNAWTYFMNDASFNNPTTALPQQGLGIAGRVYLSDHRWYLAGGLHDANGTPTRIDFPSFFQVREYFSWLEFGWQPSPTRMRTGEGVHVTAWHADARTDAEVPESWGVTYSAALKIGGRWLPFVRAGYSPRDDSPGVAILLSSMLSAGVGVDVRTSDRLGVAVTWGRPPQHGARDQTSWEAFYRIQLNHQVQVTPGFQWTFDPAYNTERDQVRVGSVVRLRIVL